MKPILIMLIVLLILQQVPGEQLQAAEKTFHQGALTVSIETDWTGGSFGGYYPIRMRIKNEGPATDLTVRFGPSPEVNYRLPEVTDRLQLDQQGTVTTTLSVPLVSAGYLGELTFADESGVLADLTDRITIPDRQYDSDTITGSILILSEDLLKTDPLNYAIENYAFQVSGGYSGASCIRIDPELLSTKWIDYSSVDLIALEPQTWDAISEAVRSAIIQWAEAGGTVLLYNASEDNRISEAFSAVSPLGAQWRSSNREIWRRINLPGGEEQDSEINKEEWPGGFRYRSTLAGLLVVMEFNPFPGSANDWFWFCSSIGDDRLAWGHRWGINARRSNATFLEFLIPSVQGVPVAAFLTLITLFTFAIGPVNYFLCLRRKQLTLLLVTVPLIAFGTSLLLASASTVSHGFSVKSRARSITLLDQNSRHQVTICREALFSGFRSIPELNFSTDTAVFPIRPRVEQFQSRKNNDYTGGDFRFSQGQTLTRGWLPARTRTQFLTVNHQVSRQRLEVTGLSSQGAQGSVVEVSNGLESDIEKLYLTDAEGNMWFAEQIPAGTVRALTPVTLENRTWLFEYLNEEVIELPEGMTPNDTNITSGLARFARRQSSSVNHYKNSIPERMINEWKLISVRPEVVRPSSYLALLKDARHLERGVEQTSPEQDLHLLWGAL